MKGRNSWRQVSEATVPRAAGVLFLAMATLATMAAMLALPSRAGATVITAAPIDFGAAEQSVFQDGVASFTDSNPAATPADFTATIDWGDGTPVTAGTFGLSEDTFVVVGQHTYADEGVYNATVTISDVAPGTGTATVNPVGTISEADVLSGTPKMLSAMPGISFSGTVATFSDSLTSAVASDFSATIDWGDGTSSAGTVTGGGGAFEVSGTHTYAAAGTFPVVVTLADDPPGTATATVTSTAQVLASVVTVPTLDFRGLLVLGLALVGAAFYLLRARQRRPRGWHGDR
jgi:hypothetical protein